jgi:hypothetical protein
LGWFDHTDESEPAVQHALRIARDKALPATARSCTRAEFLGRFRKLAIIAGTIYGLIGGGILLGLALDSGQESRGLLVMAASMLAIGALVIWLVIRWRFKRSSAYRDPEIAIDVGADGIIVRAAGGNHGMRWHEIEARPTWVKIKSNVHFIGLQVQSPFGPVQLDEQHYQNGHVAAALIVRGIHDDYHARQKARVERIG